MFVKALNKIMKTEFKRKRILPLLSRVFEEYLSQ